MREHADLSESPEAREPRGSGERKSRVQEVYSNDPTAVFREGNLFRPGPFQRARRFFQRDVSLFEVVSTVMELFDFLRKQDRV